MALGSALGAHLHELAWGRDPRRVVPEEPEKSIGHEETFSTDIDDPAVIHRELLLLAERTAGRLRSGGWLARTVSIKVRFADFATITRSRTLDVPTDVGQELYDTARALYDALGLDRARIRLVGVRAERLIDAGSAPQQLELGAREHGRRDAELAADRAARRFGAGAVRPATLLHRNGRPRRAEPTPERACSGHPERVIIACSRRVAARSPFARCAGLVSSAVPSAEASDGLGSAHLEVDVPLSEHEQRLLEQIERALVDDDPKFASSVRTGDRRLKARRKLQLGAVLVVVGLAVLVGGAVAQSFLVGALGSLVELRRHRPRRPELQDRHRRGRDRQQRPRHRPRSGDRGQVRPRWPGGPPAAEEPSRGAFPPPLRPVADRNPQTGAGTSAAVVRAPQPPPDRLAHPRARAGDQRGRPQQGTQPDVALR